MTRLAPIVVEQKDRLRRALTGLVIEVFRLNGDLLAAGDALVGDLGLTSARWQVLGAIALSHREGRRAKFEDVYTLLRPGKDQFRFEVAAACAGLQRYVDVTPPGLWRDRLSPDGRFVEEPASASSFYHIVCALKLLFEAAAAPPDA